MPETATSATPYRTVLGFDHGTVRIGVAVGQGLTRSARPLCVLMAQNGTPNWSELLSLIQEWQPTDLIVGVPRHADGQASKTTQATLAFAKKLREHTGLSVHTIDERLSSYEAQQRLPKRKPSQRKPILDPMAAAIILETWLNQQESPAYDH